MSTVTVLVFDICFVQIALHSCWGQCKKTTFWFVRLYYKSRHQLRGHASAGFENALRDVTARLGVKGENSEWEWY